MNRPLLPPLPPSSPPSLLFFPLPPPLPPPFSFSQRWSKQGTLERGLILNESFPSFLFLFFLPPLPFQRVLRWNRWLLISQKVPNRSFTGDPFLLFFSFFPRPSPLFNRPTRSRHYQTRAGRNQRLDHVHFLHPIRFAFPTFLPFPLSLSSSRFFCFSLWPVGDPLRLKSGGYVLNSSFLPAGEPFFFSLPPSFFSFFFFFLWFSTCFSSFIIVAQLY